LDQPSPTEHDGVATRDCIVHRFRIPSVHEVVPRTEEGCVLARIVNCKRCRAGQARQFCLHARQNQLVAKVAKPVVADNEQALHDAGRPRPHSLRSSTQNMK